MSRIGIVWAAMAFVAPGSAAIKPLDGDLKPENHKSTILFKTTPQGDLKARVFAEQSIAARTRTDFYTAAGQKHGFFNQAPWQNVVLRQTDLFLGSLSYLQGPPTISDDAKAALKKELP